MRWETRGEERTRNEAWPIFSEASAVLCKAMIVGTIREQRSVAGLYSRDIGIHTRQLCYLRRLAQFSSQRRKTLQQDA